MPATKGTFPFLSGSTLLTNSWSYNPLACQTNPPNETQCLSTSPHLNRPNGIFKRIYSLIKRHKRSIGKISKCICLSTLLCSLSILSGCGEAGNNSMELSSGKEIKILGKKRVKLDSNETALVLKYRTNLKLSRAKSLSKEVEEIWNIFKEEVEEADLRYAIITASTKSMDTASFMYERSDNGSWKLVNSY